MMMRRGMIEKLRDGVADFIKARPIEVAKHDPLFRFLLRSFNEPHLCAKVRPSLAVENQSVDPGPKLRIQRFGKIVLPPKIKRQIGIEMGKDNTREEFDAWTLQRKRNLLGTNLFATGARNMAMRIDPGFNAVFFRFSIRSDYERATGVVLRNPGNQLRVFLKRIRLLAVNREIDQRRAGHCVFAFPPQFFQLLVDLSDLDRLA